MAITYKFLCNQCEYKDELEIGTTRMAMKAGIPSFELGSCLSCGKLFSNQERFCTNCNLPETPRFRYKVFKLIFFNEHEPKKLVKFYAQDNVKEIPCPNCNHNYLQSAPIIFSD